MVFVIREGAACRVSAVQIFLFVLAFATWYDSEIFVISWIISLCFFSFNLWFYLFLNAETGFDLIKKLILKHILIIIFKHWVSLHYKRHYYSSTLFLIPMNTLSDEHLARQIKKSDKQAFETFYFRYHKLLFHYIISRIQCPETTREIIQDIFKRLWQNRKGIDAKQPIKDDGFCKVL